MARVGYDFTIGYLKGGIDAWEKAGKETESILSIPAQQFVDTYEKETINVLDVRKPGEYEAQNLEKAESKPLDYINEWTNYLDKDQKYFIHCAGGYRSVIAASILKARGFTNLVDVAGGFSAIEKTGVKTTAFVCPTKK